ncbi:hypothetical protein BGZ46_006738, partial [Entomortierella lignicola]
MTEITLTCIVEGERKTFPVDISLQKSIGHLAEEIKKKQSPLFNNIRASDLVLWRVAIPSSPARTIKLSSLTADDKKSMEPKELDESDD